MLTERRIRVAAVVENVPVVCEFVVEAARDVGLDERGIHYCRLAVDEACTNIVEHAYGHEGESNTFDVTCCQDDDQLVITIEDSGEAFDPTTQPDPKPNPAIEDLKPGGWGVFFIKKMMDHVAYHRADGQNVLTLRKQAPRPSVQMPAPLAINMNAITPQLVTITPDGQIDVSNARTLETALTQALNGGHRQIVLNLERVNHLSSAGIKVIVAAWQRSRDVKGDVVLVSPTPRVSEFLNVVGLDLVLTILPSHDAALHHFKVKR